MKRLHPLMAAAIMAATGMSAEQVELPTCDVCQRRKATHKAQRDGREIDRCDDCRDDDMLDEIRP